MRDPEINAVSGISVSKRSSQRGSHSHSSDYPFSPFSAASATHWHHSHHRESERPGWSVSLPLQRSLLQSAGGVWISARNRCDGRRVRAENWQLKTTETVGCPRPLWRQLALLKARRWEGVTGRTEEIHPIISSSPLPGCWWAVMGVTGSLWVFCHLWFPFSGCSSSQRLFQTHKRGTHFIALSLIQVGYFSLADSVKGKGGKHMLAMHAAAKNECCHHRVGVLKPDVMDRRVETWSWIIFLTLRMTTIYKINFIFLSSEA